MLEAGCYADGSKFNPEMEEEEYYNECEPDIVATVVRGLVPEPTYSDDDYIFINHTDPKYDGVRNSWKEGGPILHEMAEKECEFFTGSRDSQCFGFNPEPEKVFPVVEREHKRRSSSTAPSNKTKESLEVVVKRVNEVLDRKDEALNKIFIDGLTKLKIGNCSDLNKSLSVLHKDPDAAKLFINKFKEETNEYVLSTQEMEYLRVCSTHMGNR